MQSVVTSVQSLIGFFDGAPGRVRLNRQLRVRPQLAACGELALQRSLDEIIGPIGPARMHGSGPTY